MDSCNGGEAQLKGRGKRDEHVKGREGKAKANGDLDPLHTYGVT